jgi:hypothetical protein
LEVSRDKVSGTDMRAAFPLQTHKAIVSHELMNVSAKKNIWAKLNTLCANGLARVALQLSALRVYIL